VSRIIVVFTTHGSADKQFSRKRYKDEVIYVIYQILESMNYVAGYRAGQLIVLHPIFLWLFLGCHDHWHCTR